jgi:pumilio RNA-binding family
LEADGHEKRMALSKIHGSVLKMAFESLGCRVVQLAFDVADASERQVMVGELRGHVRDMISSPHANFVIQKVIEVLPVSSANFVAEELLTYAADAARHRFACRILCRLIEHHLCDNMGSTTTTYLIDELLHETEKLIRHNFARHVIELVLEHGSATQQERIIRAIRNDVFRNAKDRYASYVVEQVMYRCSIPERDALAFDLISDIDSFWTLANHECGSHVIKALLKSHGQMCIRANELLNAGASTLCTSKHGHRLLEEIQGSLL